MRRSVWLVLPATLFLLLAHPGLAFAHPLGNFTINHYSRLEVQRDAIRIRYVLDEAEIPTYQELAALHTPGSTGGERLPTDQEAQDLLAAHVQRLGANLHLTINGQPLTLTAEPSSGALSFPQGQGGLRLLRVTVWFRTDLTGAVTAGTNQAEFRDDNDADRLGWKEIVVRAAGGAAIRQSSATAVDQSDELRSYPTDMRSSPLDVRRVTFSFVPTGAADVTTPAGLLQPRGQGGGLLAAATNAFTGLVTRQTLSLPFVALALLAAVALGGVHALSPGHGKTIVGAYLVGSRGTPRHAVILGLTVTVTHTTGVFALGLVTLFASRYVLPERLYPWLSVLSGLVVVALGAWLLRVRLAAALQRPTRSSPLVLTGATISSVDLTEASDQVHAVGHVHGPRDHLPAGIRMVPAHHDVHASEDHRHDHVHARDGGDVHEHGEHSMEHDHGGSRHVHVLPAPEHTSWRSLLALGVSGGLLPCPSALVVLLAAISLQRVGFGMLLVIAFSVGLAGVLTGIGLLLISARDWFTHVHVMLGAGRFLPALSALVVLMLGLAITAQALTQTGLLLA